jgi:hypothetical protein
MSLGPLTTSFTPPGGAFGDCAYSVFDWFYYNNADVCGPVTPDSCMPESYVTDSTAYYSPGIYCPVGYMIVSTSVVLNTSPGGIDQAVTWCCPQEADCSGPAFLHKTETVADLPARCRFASMTITTSPVPTAAGLSCRYSLTPGYDATITYLDSDGTATSTVTTTVTGTTRALNALAIQLRNPASTITVGRFHIVLCATPASNATESHTLMV